MYARGRDDYTQQPTPVPTEHPYSKSINDRSPTPPHFPCRVPFRMRRSSLHGRHTDRRDLGRPTETKMTTARGEEKKYSYRHQTTMEYFFERASHCDVSAGIFIHIKYTYYIMFYVWRRTWRWHTLVVDKCIARTHKHRRRRSRRRRRSGFHPKFIRSCLLFFHKPISD